jgi:alkaline phosphatase D
MRMMIVAGLAALLAGCQTAPPPPVEAPRSAVASGPLADFPQAPVSPALPTGPLTTIALSSCSNEDWNRNQRLLGVIAAAKPDLLLMMGDNVYGSDTGDDPQLSDLRSAYWQQARRREFVKLVSSVPTLAIWDDHDFGKNDAGGEDFPQRGLAQQMFDAFWRIGPDDPRAHDDGVYGAWTFGPEGQRVQIIMLDTRYNRSPLKPTDERGAVGKERYLPDADPKKTVLGERQWKWLEAELKKPADLRLVVSSIQIVAEGHGWERWGNFPLELKRFYDLVASTGAKGVVVLSGDRHYSAINRTLPGVTPYPIYDFTSSAINMPWTVGSSETLPTMVTPGEFGENYGLVRIDWTARTITLETRNAKDQPAFTQVVPFAAIGS